MKNRELIEMTEFIKNVNNENISHKKFHKDVLEYAKLLETPLTINMFYICDKNGNPLENPELDDSEHTTIEEHEFDKKFYKQRIKEYKEASEKVIFDNFDKIDILGKNIVIYLKGYNGILMYLKPFNIFEKYTTVKDIINLGIKLK